MAVSSDPPWSREEFELRLRALGARYHIFHPYQVKMNAGELTRDQIQGWIANRFYYQINIPLKDAAILANCPDREVRRQWVQRVLDHDGYGGAEGGIEAWLRLGEAVGLTREEVLSEQHVLPGVRFAVDAYVNFARRATWQDAATSSLTWSRQLSKPVTLLLNCSRTTSQCGVSTVMLSLVLDHNVSLASSRSIVSALTTLLCLRTKSRVFCCVCSTTA